MVDFGQLKAAALLLATVALASHSVAAEPSQDRYSLGTDSLTWAIDGYSLIGTWERASLPGVRWHVEAFGIEIPEGLVDGFEGNTGEGWRRRIHLALMLSADHHPLAALPGLHWGAGFNVQRTSVSRRGIDGEQTYDLIEPIVRVGYQWFPLADVGLFLTPYMVLGVPIHLSEPEPIGGQAYKEAALLPAASVQVGWRFAP